MNSENMKHLTATQFYNILVEQSGQLNQNCLDPDFLAVVQADESSGKGKIYFSKRVSNLKNAKNTLHLIIIGDDHMKVAETCAEFDREDIDILVYSEYKNYKRIFGSLEEFGYRM